MVRQIGLIYRKDKALSKAALGFIEVTMQYAAIEGRADLRMAERARIGKPAAEGDHASGYGEDFDHLHRQRR